MINESYNRDRFSALKQITIQIQNSFRSFKVISTQASADWFRVKFEDVDTPEIAALLTGGEIVISSYNRLTLSGDEFYVDDLVGCRTVSDKGDELGHVTEIIHQDHHDIWVIDGAIGEVLVPAVREFIVSVDLDKHLVIIREIEGLWNTD